MNCDWLIITLAATAFAVTATVVRVSWLLNHPRGQRH